MFLSVHSHYSLKYGTMPIKALVECAVKHGYNQLLLTDINNSSGAMEFVSECNKAGIDPILGIDFRRDEQPLYVGIARNREGFKELNDFLTFYNLNKQPLPDRPWKFQQVYVVYPLNAVRLDVKLRDNEYIGIAPYQLNWLFGKPLKQVKGKLVAFNAVTVADRIEHRMHHYLRAIDLNTLLTKVNEPDLCHATEVMQSPDKLKELYNSYPEFLQNAERLLNDCSFAIELGISKNRKTFTRSIADDRALLEKLAYEGMVSRYGKGNRQAAKKVKEELQVIFDLNFAGYFLISADIVRYSMNRGYYHVGRGSGANSIVAYSLHITDVDPLELDLYFERFLNRERSTPPDFDIDFAWDEREDVQDYIFKCYGKEYVALLGTMTTFQGKSVIREIGKVIGLPKGEIDAFTDPIKMQHNKANPMFRQIMALYERMKEMPHQRSIHAGGVLISEEPITYYSALDLPPKNMPTVQFDMYNAELMGFEKFDILSQRGIGHIREAAKVIRQNHNISVDVHAVKQFKKDPKINGQLKSGDTIGAFYIESPAMRGLLKKLRCDNYLNLVAASSIIRPGVALSGMMRTYIERFHEKMEIEYLHPVMKERLGETYGVMVYQEDVIKICIHYAGMDGTDADILRRGMSGKWRSKVEMDRLIQRFHDKAEELGRDEEITKEIWRQISSFAGYSFSKAHSASFAVESYQSLFLKTYYPREFMVAVLNNYGGFYTRWVYVYELKKAGANVHLPCVNHSQATVSISGIDAYISLIGISGLEDRFISLIPEERNANGEYLSMEDFIKRTAITLEQCIILIRIGALRFTGESKKTLLWQVYNYLGSAPIVKKTPELFETTAKTYKLPTLEQLTMEDAYDELELLGYPLSFTMFDLSGYRQTDDILADDLVSHSGKTIAIVGNYVCEKTIGLKSGKRMYFGTFQDMQGNWFDTVHFPNTTPFYPFRGIGCYMIVGKVVVDFGFPSIEVIRFKKLAIKRDPRTE